MSWNFFYSIYVFNLKQLLMRILQRIKILMAFEKKKKKNRQKEEEMEEGKGKAAAARMPN